MKINAINSNAFKGLFTDKTAQNGGNWLMEYSPYSWEKNNTSKMSDKQKVDVYASTLPDNEELYTKFANGAESSRDILGTESYYLHSDGKMRRTITEVPAMNREESLKVLNKKLGVFLRMKDLECLSIKSQIPDIPKAVREASANYRNSEGDIPVRLFSTSYERGLAMENMRNIFDNVKGYAIDLYNKLNLYAKLKESADSVRTFRETNSKEIAELESLRKAGNLIDISRRDIQEPDNALIDNLVHGFSTLKSKFLCLPNKLISMDEILRILGCSAETSESKRQIINYIKKLI